MESPKSVGRITGILLLVHLAGGLMLPYILMQPALASPGFLENAAAHSVRIRTAVLLLFMGGAITVAVALTALPVFRRHGDRLAVLLVVLSAVNLALHAVENGTLLSMLSLSQAYAERGGADAALFHGLGTVVGSARRWAHFTHLLVVGSWIFTFFTVMWRSRLVPRPLAGLGILATVLQLTGVPLRAVLGLEIVTPWPCRWVRYTWRWRHGSCSRGSRTGSTRSSRKPRSRAWRDSDETARCGCWVESAATRLPVHGGRVTGWPNPHGGARRAGRRWHEAELRVRFSLCQSAGATAGATAHRCIC